MMKRNLQWNMNPIIVKELRSRMRGARAFITLTVVLLVLAGISYALYQIVVATTYYNNVPMSTMVGQTLFGGLAILELLLICGITPSITAGAISGEEEKQTYEMLLATPLRPTSILWGKLVSALSYVFVLIFAALPLSSLIFLFGGVAPRDMIKALVVLITVSVMLGTIGLFMSALLRRTGRATIISYVIVVVLLFGPLFAVTGYGILRQMEPPRWMLIPNPISALASALSSSFSAEGPGGLLWILGGGFWALSSTPISQTGIPRPLYHYSLPLYGAITLVLYLAATRLVQPIRRWRIGWKNALIGFALLSIYTGAVGLAFYTTSDRYEQRSIFARPTPFPAQVEKVMVERAVEVAPPYPPPGEIPPNQPPPEIDLTEVEQSAIYAAVIQEISGDEHEKLYIVRQTDDSVGDPNIQHFASQTLSDSLQEAVNTTLSVQDSEVQWVDELAEVPLDRTDGSVIGGGAVVTPGNILPQKDGSVWVSISIRYANLGAQGLTYVLEPIDDKWQITGDTGVIWEQ